MQAYIVEPGDNIISIASKLNVSVVDLVKENNLSNMYYLEPGLELVIPYKDVDSTDVNYDNFFDYYTVQKGDNLYQIGLKYGLTPQEIAELNGIEVNEYLALDQQLKVPKDGVKIYITKDVDTLKDVADVLQTTVNKLINDNQNIYLLPEQLIVYRYNN